MSVTKTPLDEINNVLDDLRRADARISELNGLIDQAGEKARPDLAEARLYAREELSVAQERIENSDWPPTAPLQ